MAKLARFLALLSGALLLATCGSGSRDTIPERRADSSTVSLQSALAELSELGPPPGIDRQLFERLKSALARQLRVRDGKAASAAPIGDKNAVHDLTIWSENERLRMMWSYRNVGDYDQDGTVGIADITPLAIHYDETWVDFGSIQAVVDGSENHEIGIEDITPIAVNYGVECAGYVLQNSPVPDPDDPSWNSLASFEFDLASGMGRIGFVVSADVGDHPYYRVAPYDSGLRLGVPGEVVEFVPQPPEITGVSPQSGVSGELVEFTATATGPGPMGYSWDFGGGAEPDEQPGNPVMVTLGGVGSYGANVTASNGAGQDDYPFTLEVTAPVIDPPGIESVWPQGGQEGTYVEFSAVVSGTPPLTYHWDFGGGANPDTPVEESPEVLLLNSGEYEASLRVTNPADEDVFPFTLNVTSESPGAIVVDPLGGDYPGAAIVEGCPAVAYRQSSAAYYVRALDAFGTTWGEPVKIPDDGGSVPGAYNSLCVANGNPATITSAGLLIEGGMVWYSRASDSLGSAWGMPSVFWNPGKISPPPAGLCIVAGNPAVAIPDNRPGVQDLEYYRADDPSGETWTAQVLVIEDTLENEIGSCGMRLVGGGTITERPAILLSLVMDDTLFILSSDEEGSSWEAPVELESMSDTSALCVVQGNPAAVWRIGGELPRLLYYSRANDEGGADWAEKVTLDDWIECSGHIGFAVVGGRPAVAYANGPSGDRRLHYVVAEDGLGENWGTPVVVDGETLVRENVALLEVSGRPAVFYCEQEGQGTLRYIRALDSFGLEWPE